jgi:hypothetical protein
VVLDGVAPSLLLHSFAGDVLVFATVMNMLNIPYKEKFTVNTVWEVKPKISGGCSVSIRLKVWSHPFFLSACLHFRCSYRHTFNQDWLGFELSH